jgi:hypothetical protein
LPVLNLFDAESHQILELDSDEAEEHKSEEGVADQLMDGVSAVPITKLGYNLHVDYLHIAGWGLRLLACLLHSHPLYGFKQVEKVRFEHRYYLTSKLGFTVDSSLRDK